MGKVRYKYLIPDKNGFIILLGWYEGQHTIVTDGLCKVTMYFNFDNESLANDGAYLEIRVPGTLISKQVVATQTYPGENTTVHKLGVELYFSTKFTGARPLVEVDWTGWFGAPPLGYIFYTIYYEGRMKALNHDPIYDISWLFQDPTGPEPERPLDGNTSDDEEGWERLSLSN